MVFDIKVIKLMCNNHDTPTVAYSFQEHVSSILSPCISQFGLQ